MDSLTHFDKIIQDLESKPLSEIIPHILPLALECKDYSGYCILSFWLSPIVENPNINAIQRNEIFRALVYRGLSIDAIVEIANKSSEEYLQMKTVSEDEISSHSAKEIENWLHGAQKTLASVTNVPRESYKNLSDRIMQVERMYEALRSFVISKVMLYQQIIKKKSEDSVKGNMNGKKEPIIFLSHCSSNKKYGDALEKLLTGLGIKSHQLIYTSHPLHKIPLDKNIYEYLRENIDRETFVIILWSDEYLDSPACLNEMGAAWVMQSDYTNLYVPNFSFGNPKYHQCAVDTRKMGAVLNGDQHCMVNMIELKNKILKMFGLQVDEYIWTYLLDEFIRAVSTDRMNVPRLEDGVLIFD